MADTSNPTVSVKLVLLGEAAVGKSSLVSRFVNDEFHENKEPTIGAAFLTQKCSLSDRTVKFEIWDTAGQERFASLAPMYYRNAQSALVVYDVTKPASFVRARHWVNEIKSQGSPNTAIALVGNKVDLLESADNKATGDDSSPTDGAGSEDGENADNTAASGSASRENPLRKVSVEEGEKFAEQEGLMFFEASAKTSQNVRKIFLALASKVPIEQKRPAPTGRIGEDTNVNLAAGSAAAGKSNCAC